MSALKRNLVLIFAVVLLGLQVACAREVRMEHKTLIAGIQFESLLLSWWPQISISDRELKGKRNVYICQNGEDPSVEVHIGIYETEDLARKEYEETIIMTSVGPTAEEHRIGDELSLWRSSAADAGALLFRRDNAVFYLLGPMSLDNRLALAERLDRSLLKETAFIERNVTVTPPRITRLALPEEIETEKRVNASIKVSGLYPDIGICALTNNVVVHLTPVPRLTYFAPDEAGSDEIILAISDKKNLVNIQNFLVNVVQPKQ